MDLGSTRGKMVYSEEEEKPGERGQGSMPCWVPAALDPVVC